MCLYQIAFYEKNSATILILLIICFNFIAEIFSIGALPVDLFLLLIFVVVRAATYFDHQL